MAGNSSATLEAPLKFLCENCRAKYQIADEKIAGRTVRMKCRKCGNLIEVEASVTETSTAAKAPHAPTPKPLGAAGGPPPRPSVSAPRGAAGRGPSTAEAAPSGPVVMASSGEASVGGLAGAFSKAVSSSRERPSAASAAFAVLSSSSPSTEEWYVGINGVPVGPVRLGELRRKAAAGAVGQESLVWREGFEEWVPLRTFPELLAMVKEAVATGRASLTPTPPPTSRAVGGAQRAMPGVPAPRPPTPRPGAAAAARSNVVALSSRRATAEKLEGLADEDVVLEFEGSVPPPADVQAATPFGDASAQPLSLPPPSIEALRLAGVSPPLVRRIPLGVVVAVLGSVLVGLSIMVLLEQRRSSGVQIVSVPIPVAPLTAPTAAAGAGEGPGVTTIGPIEIGAATSQKGGAGAARATAKAPDTPAAPGAAPVNTSLTGLGGLVGGPTVPGGGSSSSGGGQLAAVDVERVVQSHRAFVKRQCWETALAAKPANAPPSARVVVSLTVGSDGRVQSATASGGDAYPGLGSCVQGQVKNWTFPRSDGATVSVPFVFAAQ